MITEVYGIPTTKVARKRERMHSKTNEWIIMFDVDAEEETKKKLLRKG